MEQINNKQSRIILEIESLLNKMSNQVNFLVRKEIAMSQLDLDLLMENTRKLYDRLCSVELGVEDVSSDLESTDTDNEDADTDIVAAGLEDADSANSDMDSDTEDLVSDSEDFALEVENFDDMAFDTDDEENISEEEEIVDSNDDNDDVDMVWDFTKDHDEELGVDEEELEVEEEEDEAKIEDEVESEDEEKEIEEVVDSFVDVPVEVKKEEPKEEDSGIRAYRVVRDNSVHTLGDKLEKAEDNSLVARLQRKPVTDLIAAIGINDKFLFLNELFGGSMEKYNKSIRSLNSFSTLLGAKTYMSELQIEFQWDCESEAYKKLNDLIERRFL